jgi:DNA polymerase elongation subunit (family B)
MSHSNDDLEKCECGYETDDVFDMFDHTGIDMQWQLKVSKDFSFNLYSFFEELSRLSRQGNSEEVYDAIQAISYMLYKAAENEDFDSQLKDVFVRKESEELIENLERMLKDNG